MMIEFYIKRNVWVLVREEIYLLLVLKGFCFLDLVEGIIGFFIWSDLFVDICLVKLWIIFGGGEGYVVFIFIVYLFVVVV